ncbi:glucosidase 2 subunit beta [Ixodes scapularis]|uniref:glucosidase 2 subunit beta n=1 Tax=Ixodes scapularis TaxID=6945 RepID=UPI001C381E76|nr:glucosidase 2 subunit beta [Ixodes scapularis]XP_042142387.1 glucosidase 2 subunit beta [Ixodes scapularis]
MFTLPKLRTTVKRRHLLLALFVIGVLYMTRQLFSLREVSRGSQTKGAGRPSPPSSAKTVAAPGDGKGEMPSVRGVAPQDQALYANRKWFKCLKGDVTIMFTQVNDDYCDCEDGSDEPATNACLNGRFFCKQETPGKPGYIPATRVNDGICDCCDGSDEWLGVFAVPQLRLSEKQQMKLGTFQAPCKVRC